MKPDRNGQPSNLSVADQVWQGTKAGLKAAPWGLTALVGGGIAFNSGDKGGERTMATALAVHVAAPIAVGAISGLISGVAGSQDKTAQGLHTVTDGAITPLSVGLKAGHLVSGISTPMAALAVEVRGLSTGRVVSTQFGLATGTLASAAAASVVGATFSKNSASRGGALVAGATGGALVGAVAMPALTAFRSGMVFGKVQLAGTFKNMSMGKSIGVGLAVGAAVGLVGALTEYETRKK